MKKWKLSYIIDAAMFISMASMAGIGLLMKYVLIPGRDAQIKYGSKIDLYFLGLDRHQWGTIHFIVSLVLIGLLTLHIIIHWKMIVQLFRRFVPSGPARTTLGYSFLIVSIILLGFPLLVKPELRETEPLRRFAAAPEAASADPVATPDAAAAEVPPPLEQTLADTAHVQGEVHSRTLDIQGYMTLREVARRHEVPEEHLLRQLGISERGAAGERLGQLRRRYDFRMSTIEEIIMEYRLKNPPSYL